MKFNLAELDGIRVAGFTAGLRSAGALLWCVGFFLVVFDLLGVDIAGWHIPLCFAFFFLAAGLCFWAEKREFSTRVALYRLHDLVIYTPWRFLLLYFLWINLFAPFTAQPVRSVVYAVGGWACLIAIGVTANFLFCERRPSGAILLLRDRLSLLFWGFGLAASAGLIAIISTRIWPDFPVLMHDEANFFLFLLLGLPFLLWDLLLHGRNLLPRAFSAFVSLIVIAALVLTMRKIFWIGIVLVFAMMLALRIYKRMRYGRALLVFTTLLFCSIGLSLLLLKLPFLQEQQQTLEARLNISVGDALRVALEHRLLGMGIAVSSNRNGIWAQILAELGFIGVAFYSGFLLNLLRDLYVVGREPRIVVSNVGLVSLVVFGVLVSHYYTNAYAPSIWVWYAVWTLLATSNVKKEAATT